MDKQLSEKAIFNVARKIDSVEARAEYLHQLCRDPSQYDRIMGLLQIHDEEQSFLAAPAEALMTISSPSNDGGMSEGPGHVVGPYKLLQQIGEGGFGVVYMAEQTAPIRRKLALKIVKPGMDSKEIIARFEAERQALALMDHPNIARVLDAGTTEGGRPFFVMELVHGVPITTFCDDQKLTTRERLELFVTVCRAVQHAHQKGIIHRDLKPSNVMVTLHDDRAVPKVIDFGVSKALSQQLTERTMFTAFGQMVGTPLYMSPEQAQMSGLDVDTRSDVYSLGVLLYELLTGTTPFDSETLKRAGFDEMRRMIREDEPLRPSARVSTLAQNLLSTVSDRRSIDARKLGQSYRGELDWIVMKAMEKDRTRRYESANELASDVERFLNDETVQACPPSASYRLSKLVRRHKAAMTTAALLAVALMLGMIGTATQAMRANAARTAVEIESRETRRLLARTYLERGQSLAEEGDPATGMLWMARSLQTAPADAGEVRRVIRRNIAAWCERLAPLQQVLDHQSPVQAVCFSPDGARVLTAGNDRVARIWDVASGQPLGDLVGHEGKIVSANWSPDGALVVTGGWDATARVWDATTFVPVGEPFELWKQVFGMYETRNAVLAVAFSPDSSMILAGANSSPAHLWDIESHAPAGPAMIGHGSSVTSVAFSPDGDRIATGCLKGNVRIWNSANCELVGEIEVGNAVSFVEFSRDGSRVSTGGAGPGYVDVWDTATCEHLDRLVRPGPISAAAYCSVNSTILTSQLFSTSARIWQAETGEPVPGVLRHGDRTTSVDVSSDGSRMLTGSRDGTARVWQRPGGQSVSPEFGDRSLMTQAAAFSPNGSRVLTGSSDGCLRVWNVHTSELIAGPLDHEPEVNNPLHSVAFSPDGRRFVSASRRGTVQVWNADTFARIGECHRDHGDMRTVIAFSPDGQRILTGDSLGTAQVWDADTMSPVGAPIRNETAVQSVAFTADGAMLIGTKDGTVRRHDAATGNVLGTVLEDQGGVQISRDGAWIATYSPGGLVQLWDVKTGVLVADSTSSHRLPPSLEHGILAISPDGSLLLAVVVLSEPGALVEKTAVAFIDAATGIQVGPYQRFSGAGIRTAVFSPDGSSVLMAGEGPSQICSVPRRAINGDDEQISLWTQVMTGMELNDGDLIRVLDGASWRQRRNRLRELGGSPSLIPVASEPQLTIDGSEG